MTLVEALIGEGNMRGMEFQKEAVAPEGGCPWGKLEQKCIQM